MAVTEAVAKLWGRLANAKVLPMRTEPPPHRRHQRYASTAFVPTTDWGLFDGDTLLGLVPDPANRTWEWVKLLWAAGYDVEYRDGIAALVTPENRLVRGDGGTPETALAAAIEKLAEEYRDG